MTAPIQSIERANEELSGIHREIQRVEEQIRKFRLGFREIAKQLSDPEQPVARTLAATTEVHNQVHGRPLKTNPELSVKVQKLLGLATRKEAEIVIGAVVSALERTLLDKLATDGFSLKLGQLGKFKVRHLQSIVKRVGFSGATVITKEKRKIRFLALGALRASETVQGPKGS